MELLKKQFGITSKKTAKIYQGNFKKTQLKIVGRYLGGNVKKKK